MKSLAPQSALNVTNSPVLICSSGPIRVAHYHIVNPNNAISYVQVFDAKAANAVTLGTTVPVVWFAIGANGVLNDSLAGDGLEFPNGIVIAATTSPSNNTAPSSALNVELFTKS